VIMTEHERPVRESGTAGDDVMTVHALTDGKPACGATGEVVEWQRAVTCPTCLTDE
jgi:hypothetical protein